MKYSTAVAAIVLASSMESVTAGPLVGILGRVGGSLLGGALTSGGSSSKSSRSIGSAVVSGGEDVLKDILKSFGSGAASEGGKDAVSAVASKVQSRSMPTASPAEIEVLRRSLGSLVVDGGEDIFKTLAKAFGSGAASQGGSDAVSAVASKVQSRSMPTGSPAEIEMLRRSVGSAVVSGGEDILKDILKSFGSGAASEGGNLAVSAVASKIQSKRAAPTATSAAAPAATNKWEDGMVQCMHEYAADDAFSMTSNGNDTVTLNNVGPQCMGVATSYLADPASQHLDPMFGSLKILSQNTVQLYNIPQDYLKQIEANIAVEQQNKAAAQ